MFVIRDEALIGPIEIGERWVVEGCRIYSDIQAALDAGETNVYVLKRQHPAPARSWLRERWLRLLGRSDARL